MQKRPQIAVHLFLVSETLIQALPQKLGRDRYTLTRSESPQDFLTRLGQHKHQVDCLILEQSVTLPQVIRHLHRNGIVLPTVILRATATRNAASARETHGSGASALPTSTPATEAQYHNAEVILPTTKLSQLPQSIDTALTKFLRLTAACRLALQNTDQTSLPPEFDVHQNQLSEKLKERLGYLGIYYKRNPDQFLRNLPDLERQQLLDELKADYQAIILTYFRKNSSVNSKIDEFVNKSFFADVSVSQVLEMHMELMDLLAKKLKLEGRSDEILLDYRLTLIDTISHLCEMYRRSIPRDP